MGEIKSALEIALERTASVAGDKEAVAAGEARKEGKILVSRFLDDPEASLVIPGKSGKEQEWLREGVIQVLLANLVLPQDQPAVSRVKRIGVAFAVVKKDRRIGQIFSQLESFMTEYVEERDRLRELVGQQYEPRLRQKEQELSKRMGQPVRIDPMTDPDFLAALRKANAQLDERYGTVLGKVKKDLGQLVEG